MFSKNVLTIYDYSNSISDLVDLEFNRVIVLNSFNISEIDHPVINVISNLDYNSLHTDDYKYSLTFGAYIELKELNSSYYTARVLPEELFIRKSILETYISNVNKAKINFLDINKLKNK